jgi:hypothetical protein
MLFNYCCVYTARARQRVSATPRAKIELIPISDADHAEILPLPSPHWFIDAGTHVPSPHWLYPRGERLTVLPVVVVIL